MSLRAKLAIFYACLVLPYVSTVYGYLWEPIQAGETRLAASGAVVVVLYTVFIAFLAVAWRRLLIELEDDDE